MGTHTADSSSALAPAALPCAHQLQQRSPQCVLLLVILVLVLVLAWLVLVLVRPSAGCPVMPTQCGAACIKCLLAH
jgi:hypothetical protein